MSTLGRDHLPIFNITEWYGLTGADTWSGPTVIIDTHA